jgi:biotin transporter BioY
MNLRGDPFDCRPLTCAMTIENGTAIVLAYVLVSMGVIIAFLLAAFVIGWFVGRLRQRRREQSGEE